MEKEAREHLLDLEEKVRFFAEIGVEFILPVKPPSFEEIEERILKCQLCSLSRERTHAVPGEGNKNADLMFVGEAPGHDEDIQGRPFVGRAGQLLTKIIKAMNFQREGVFITNVIKCRPPNNRNPYGEEIESCKDYLIQQIQLINPSVIVALGNVAVSFFFKSSKRISDLRGHFGEYGGIPVMPTFHPSYLIRNEGNRMIKKMVWEDMKKVMALLGQK